MLNCSVISQRSCSGALDKRWARQGSLHQHKGQVDVASLFVHWGSLLLCSASPRPGSPSLAEHSSVCQILLCSETFAVNCLCFLSISIPQTWLTSSIYISVHHSFPLLLYMSFFPSSHCPSLPPVSIRHHSCQITPPPRPLLCCGGRSDQDRWSQMISGLYSFLQETAWYCCWHDALSGCPQVQECHHSTLSAKLFFTLYLV